MIRRRLGGDQLYGWKLYVGFSVYEEGYNIDFVFPPCVTVPSKMQECCPALLNEKHRLLEVSLPGGTLVNARHSVPRPVLFSAMIDKNLSVLGRGCTQRQVWTVTKDQNW